jgi:hypothetical protein
MGADTGKPEAAKQEAREVADTAGDAAKDVAHVAKEEGASVVREAKHQVGDLYAQARDELSQQAATQQHRVAQGLRSFSEELASMARSSDDDGMASSLVHRASERAGQAATWLGERDPAGLLEEVKSFARRRPGMFIAGAAIAGVLVGRLTRALAQGAAESSQGSTSRGAGTGQARQSSSGIRTGQNLTGAGTAQGTAQGVTTGGASVESGLTGFVDTETDLPSTAASEDAPLYSESASRFAQERREGTDERPDAL